jgi:hypothetical protein
MRFVTEKHKEVVLSLDQLVKALVGENAQNKVAKAEDALKKARDLQSAISKQDSPAWLPSLVQGLHHYVTKSWNQQHLINHLIDNVANIKQHEWAFVNAEEKAFDFDSIYEHYKSESRIPELFDEIINILEEIEASGEIDSLTMITALGKVLATLKQNRNGSYFSLNSAWEFLVSFLKNYMWSELSKLPMLGSAMEALEKTIKETNEEMFKVHSSIEKEMSNVVETEIKGLKGKSAFPFISYDRSGAKLSDNIEKLTVNQKV